MVNILRQCLYEIQSGFKTININVKYEALTSRSSTSSSLGKQLSMCYLLRIMRVFIKMPALDFVCRDAAAEVYRGMMMFLFFGRHSLGYM